MKKYYIRNIKENVGAATTLVVVTILGFIMILSAAFTLISALLNSQMNSNIRIQQFYSGQVSSINSIYEEAFYNIYLEPKTISQAKISGVFLRENTMLLDDYDNNVIVPKGFKIASDSGTNVAEGIVIEDQDIIEGIGNNKGNQYVWIPVGNGIKKSNSESINITLGRYTFSDGNNGEIKGAEKLVQSAESFAKQSDDIEISNLYKELLISREGIKSSGIDGLNTTAINLEGFINSVNINGGYYIARYEASYGIDEKPNSKISNSYNSALSTTITKNEGMLWNNIVQIDAARLSRNIYSDINYTNVKTDLVNSYAWDTAIVYIQKFSGDVDYSRRDIKNINPNLTNTGVNNDERCKINDMASNMMEWTTEYSNYMDSSNAYPCVGRGGNYNDTGYYASNRNINFSNGMSSDFGFRSILYI